MNGPVASSMRATKGSNCRAGWQENGLVLNMGRQGKASARLLLAASLARRLAQRLP